MKFWEALKHIQEGKKVRVKDWNDDWYVYKSPSGKCIIDEEGKPVHLTYEDSLCVEWELYEEPEKTYTWMEVVEGLKEGKVFARKKFKSSTIRSFRTLSPFGRIIRPTNHRDHPPDILLEDYQATDWIEVKE